MKIVIFNEELRSEMQMYLALCRRHDVEIADGVEDLMQLLDGESADLTFVDLSKEIDGLRIANQVSQKHPRVRIVGICDREDKNVQKRAADRGIKEVITRPIKNRDLMDAVDK